MTIPTLVLPASAELSQPYVTPAMFTAYPTWLDLDNLVPGGAASIQTDVLADALLAATDWCIGEVEDMPLHGHFVQNERTTTRANGHGKLFIRPRHIPVRAITALSYGWDPATLSSLTLPDTQMWIEDGRRISFLPGGGLSFQGPAIQFGGTPRSGLLTYVQWSYVAGYPSTTLASAVTGGASTVSVTDPTGILPGDVLRVYDPGKSEAMTVASTYTPAIPTSPPTVTSIPLATAAMNSHDAAIGITGMPRKILQAVIAYTVALLMREDVSEDQPESAFGPSARTTASDRGGQAAGLVNDARGWLAPYAPTRRM